MRKPVSIKNSTCQSVEVGLSAPAKKAIDHAMAESYIHISAVSAWEVAVLVRKGRLEFTMPVEDWIACSQDLPFVQFVPIDNHIAIRSTSLPGILHDDPADRIIIVTAITLGATLITKDKRIRKYAHVKTLW